MKYIIIPLFILLLVACSYQNSPSDKDSVMSSKFIELILTEKNNVGVKYDLTIIGTKGDTISHKWTYLGSVPNIKYDSLKLVNYVCISGPSQRTSSVVLIYNNRNEGIGLYNIGYISDLPNYIHKDSLIFDKTEDRNVRNSICFKDSIPSTFFIISSEEYTEKGNTKTGDFYSFSASK